jgi:HK97 family phage prohead protease
MLVHKTTTSDFDTGLNCVLSDLTEDSFRDVVGDSTHPMLGWDIADFRRNPIALWAHDSRSPIGTWRDVGVNDGALRGRLHLAPSGSTKLVDELRALLAANVVRGISVGFRPIESKPRSNGGTHYLKQTLVEASLVAVPANPSALLTAKALGISEATQRLIFKQTDLTTGQRIREARRVIQKAKLRLAKATNPKTRAALLRAIAHLEKIGSEQTAGSLTSEREQMERRVEESRMALEVAKIVREEMKSASWQSKRHTQEIIEAFTRTAQRLPQDQPKPTFERSTSTWRGVKLPGLTWRGKKI